jgi:hypothetical protein
MTSLHLSRALWRKSTYSGANGSCVEVAGVPDTIGDDQVAVRDSKDRGGPALILTARQWQSFAAGIKDGSLTLT